MYSPIFASLPPMNAKSEISTLSPSGTRTSLPPISENTVISVTSLVSSASLRSMLLPPMMLITFRWRPTRQRPLRSWPLITDTTQFEPSPVRTGIRFARAGSSRDDHVER